MACAEVVQLGAGSGRGLLKLADSGGPILREHLAAGEILDREAPAAERALAGLCQPCLQFANGGLAEGRPGVARCLGEQGNRSAGLADVARKVQCGLAGLANFSSAARAAASLFSAASRVFVAVEAEARISSVAFMLFDR